MIKTEVNCISIVVSLAAIDSTIVDSTRHNKTGTAYLNLAVRSMSYRSQFQTKNLENFKRCHLTTSTTRRHVHRYLQIGQDRTTVSIGIKVFKSQLNVEQDDLKISSKSYEARKHTCMVPYRIG